MHAVVPYGRSNSSVRTRVVAWGERLSKGPSPLAGAELRVHGPGFAKSPLPSGSTTLLLRNHGRFSRGGPECRLLRKASVAIYELDDGLPWDDGRLPRLGRWWKRPWPRSMVARTAALAADRVIVGNEFLAGWATQHCSDVRCIPTCVEPADYVQKTEYGIDGPPVLGWLGSRATEVYLAEMGPALAELHRRTGAVLEIVSSPGQVPGAMRDFASRVPWSEAVQRDRLATWDVGLMPLADGVYERAKCGYKLLQYAAAGLPAVGSPVGVNAQLLAHMDAPAPRGPDEWLDALLELVSEPTERRARRAERGREVARRHSYDTWEPVWRSAVGLAS